MQAYKMSACLTGRRTVAKELSGASAFRKDSTGVKFSVVLSSFFQPVFGNKSANYKSAERFKVAQPPSGHPMTLTNTGFIIITSGLLVRSRGVQHELN